MEKPTKCMKNKEIQENVWYHKSICATLGDGGLVFKIGIFYRVEEFLIRTFYMIGLLMKDGK